MVGRPNGLLPQKKKTIGRNWQFLAQWRSKEKKWAAITDPKNAALTFFFFLPASKTIKLWHGFWRKLEHTHTMQYRQILSQTSSLDRERDVLLSFPQESFSLAINYREFHRSQFSRWSWDKKLFLPKLNSFLSINWWKNSNFGLFIASTNLYLPPQYNEKFLTKPARLHMTNNIRLRRNYNFFSIFLRNSFFTKFLDLLVCFSKIYIFIKKNPGRRKIFRPRFVDYSSANSSSGVNRP